MDRALQSLLNWYEHVGVEIPDIPKRVAKPRRPRPARNTPSENPKLRRPQSPSASRPPATLDPAPIAASCKTLAALNDAISAYDAGALSDRATQAVFCRGNPDADLMVIGEAPGRDEDREGKPFVGKSGQLLDRMLAAIGLTDTQFYVSNVCFWRPPNNRKPTPEELDLCRPFILRHIELAQPKVILLAGGTPMQALLGLTGIMKQRGQWQTLSVGGRDIPTLPLYHPAFLLRQPALKADAWQDLLTLRERLAEIT